MESTSLSIRDKTALLQVMGERLKYLCTHDSRLLLHNTFAIPKLMCLLRTSPCFLSPSFHLYDNELQNMLSSITNTLLDDRAWLQASLPVKYGSLGIRSAVHLAPSAYLASFVGCRELTFTILSPRFQESPLFLWDSAITEWSTGHNEPPPSSFMSHCQKSWDLPRVSSIAAEFLATAPDPLSKARLLSASRKESGSWLHTLPVTSLGLHMDDNTIHIAVGLCLGTTLARETDIV